MHIGIDARFVQGPNTGVTNYLVNLLRGISRVDKNNTYSIFLSDQNYNGRIPNVDNFNILVNTANPLIWKNIWLPEQVKKLKIDMVHFPAYTGSLVNIGRNVVTIHDLIHKVNPGWFSWKELMLAGLPIQIAVKKATRIIAVSENTKSDIMGYYNIAAEKIAVTPEAADSSFRPLNDARGFEYIRKKYNIEGDFILYVGVLFKRRNIDRLLEAFSTLRGRDGIRQKLVIAGPSKEYSDLDSLINKYGLLGSVIYLNYVQQEDMPLLYNAALFFVYPSLYEGFGLPVLEAMSCGKAVITSNTSSLPEVAGDSGILIDPYNLEELRDAMYRLCHDAGLREDLGGKALGRSKIFSWDKMAGQTIDIYRQAAGGL